MSGPAAAQGKGAFVGRAGELEALRGAVEEAWRGEAAGALVVGEAGIGKTRLVTELASVARGPGVAVGWGSAWPHGGAPAYWQWVQLLRALAAGPDRRVLVDDLGADAAELGRLVPHLRGGVQLAPPAAPQGDDPRFRLYDAVASFLRRTAARRSLLLVLDDLHAADLGSLLLLQFVLADTRSDRLAVIGTTREPESEPLSQETALALGAIGRLVPTYRLDGLARPDVEHLLDELVGGERAGQLAAEIHRRSEGNPLFVGELARLMVATPTGQHQPLPVTIRAVLERRLTALSSGCLDVLRAAAVVGDEFTVPVVAEACGRPRREVVAALGEAVAARVVIDRHGFPFAFGHTLIREVLYDQLPLSDRAGLHRRVAEALEAAPSPEPPYAALAHHFLAGAPAVEDGKAARYAERAGQRAVAQFAYETAAAQFRSALAALAHAGADRSRRIPLLLALGDASLRAGDIGSARDAFVQAADEARLGGRPDLLVQAALGLGSGLDGFEVRLFDHAQISLLEEALASLDPEPSPLRAWATARLSVALTFAESTVRRLQLADEAVAMARASGDPAALAYALAARNDATAGPDHIDERVEAAGEIARLARSTGDRGLELLGRRNLLIGLLERGDMAGVDGEIDRYALVADSLRQPLYQWYVPLWRGMRTLMDGRPEQARRHRAEAAAIGARARSHNAALNADVLGWNILLKEGRWQEAADALGGQLLLADGMYGEPFWIGLVTPWIHRAEARSTLDRFTANGFADLPRDAVWLAAMTYAADAAAAVRHTGAAAQLYDLIAPHRSRFAVDAIGAACYGSMARPLGVVAAVLGRRHDALERFDQALEAHRSCGATALVAETLSDLGAALESFGDERGAQRVLVESQSLYRSCGMERRAALVSEPPAGSPVAVGDVFRCDGAYWTVTFEGRTARIADAKGLRDIAALLARPGRELHVADLIAGTERSAAGPGASLRTALLRGGGTGPLIDERSRAAYGERLRELRDELDDAEADADLGRAEQARAELDVLAHELAAGLGLGGRRRQPNDPAERARKAVTQRIRNTIKRLESVHPQLAVHLDRSLRTGSFCSYRPERPVDWDLGS